MNKSSIEALMGVLIDKTAGMIEAGDNRIAEIMAQVRDEIERVQYKHEICYNKLEEQSPHQSV